MADVTRRDFVKSTAAATALSAASYQRVMGANERLRIGIIGPGQRGKALMRNFYTWAQDMNAQMGAVCDIWTKNRELAASLVKQWGGNDAKQHRNMEETLADKEIDAVIIATADFQHAKMLEAAVKAGKDVYCEKPMATVLAHAKDAVRAVHASK